MAKKPKLDEFTIGRMRQAYLANLGLKKTALRDEISKKFQCSISTVIRYAKEGGWEELRQAVIACRHKEVTPHSVSSPPPPRYEVTVAGQGVDVEALLIQGIVSLFTDGMVSPIKSREAALATALKLIQEYRRYHPLTIDELIDAALSIPGFSPTALARRLRERIKQSS
ncbi:hypothetical protein [Leptolyngbya sp. FACHB-16]|uniref:hypothetical protein n=1 Tax=unclassified Leptolyngbya TaxID=2650499 RepID=UPI0016888FC1|nr:hypothetical protein [Leptolyngbya sp. FACHB-16]MBD2153178.1 hypothetical protein [Leptolyngbya sp. FACHB-16]